MITSKQIISLSEEWLMSISSPFKPNTSVDIYVNPTSSDLLELKKLTINYVRFIADSNTKKVYVWDGDSLLHAQAAKRLNLSRQIDFYQSIPDNTLIGTATIRNGKLYAKYSDYFYQIIQDLNRYKSEVTSGSYLEKKLNYFLTIKDKFNWVSSYIDISEITNMISRNLK